MGVSNKRLVERRRERNREKTLLFRVDIRTTNGEKIWNSSEQPLEKVLPGFLKMLKYRMNIDIDKMINEDDVKDTGGE